MGVSHLASLIIQVRMNEYLNQNRGAGNKEDGRNGNFSRICFLRKRENIASGSSNRILFKPDAINVIDTKYTKTHLSYL